VFPIRYTIHSGVNSSGHAVIIIFKKKIFNWDTRVIFFFFGLILCTKFTKNTKNSAKSGPNNFF
jgi:hypothetical protein